jgi:hypothetical protein
MRARVLLGAFGGAVSPLEFQPGFPSRRVLLLDCWVASGATAAFEVPGRMRAAFAYVLRGGGSGHFGPNHVELLEQQLAILSHGFP